MPALSTKGIPIPSPTPRPTFTVSVLELALAEEATVVSEVLSGGILEVKLAAALVVKGVDNVEIVDEL